ncbi:hypothetical protein EON64_13120 [archaeon]|nr:MAG: hypothetical protein EON64_13120 [archaeon]
MYRTQDRGYCVWGGDINGLHASPPSRNPPLITTGGHDDAMRALSRQASPPCAPGPGTGVWRRVGDANMQTLFIAQSVVQLPHPRGAHVEKAVEGDRQLAGSPDLTDALRMQNRVSLVPKNYKVLKATLKLLKSAQALHLLSRQHEYCDAGRDIYVSTWSCSISHALRRRRLSPSER